MVDCVKSLEGGDGEGIRRDMTTHTGHSEGKNSSFPHDHVRKTVVMTVVSEGGAPGCRSYPRGCNMFLPLFTLVFIVGEN